MTRYLLNIFAAILTLVGLSGCLNHGIDEPETFEGAEITGLQGIYYRYIDTNDVNPGSGEPQVKQITLARGSDINSEAATVELACQAPSNFPASQLPNLTASNLVVVLNISTAATIKPIDGAPLLGVPGDWSKPNKYEVTAANGTKKVWTVTLELL